MQLSYLASFNVRVIMDQYAQNLNFPHTGFM
jgi:hypothetical protein